MLRSEKSTWSSDVHGNPADERAGRCPNPVEQVQTPRGA